MASQVFQYRESLSSHPLFQATEDCDLNEISSPSDLGYHPDSVLSVLDFFNIYPRQMPSSGVCGDDFVAIRCAPVDEYDLTQAKVECVYLRFMEGDWSMRKLNLPVTDREFQKFTHLAHFEPVKMNGRVWKRI